MALSAAQSAGHVEFLNHFYRGQRHLYDFTRRFFLFGRERMLRNLDVRPGDAVLELGCGTARNLLRLRKRQPNATYVGVDACREMLRTAARNARGTVHLFEQRAEAIAGPAELGRPHGFERVFLSYALSMMPDFEAALRAALACVAPGGTLSIVDFWDFDGWPRLVAARLRNWLAGHHVRFEPAMHEFLRGAGAEIESVAGRWAYIARVVSPPGGRRAG
jgi:S-adenosylmethionine-diacylgycerolhomoserine-N-methlytransferase